ncbi:MAG: ABC-F family ATP-binding cassette domain-containing protein [Spirochaetales bacterium]|nr:ABC-F family ATP-binding cassette domain-containing protein [Spirochaetales bacterium]
MKFIQLNNISLAYQDKSLINDLNLNIQEKCRIAFCGNNGCGKSTLMRIIAREISADSGSISESKDTHIHFLPQNAIVEDGFTVYKEAEKAFIRYEKMIQKLEELDKAVSTTLDEVNLEKLLEQSHHIRETLEFSNYYNREKQIFMVLNGLGFSNADLEKNTETFSGGWKMRIALAKALLSQPDFLLLDEPINYLDIEAKIWLEEFIQRFPGGIILVAHDRDFLDRTTNETLEIFNGKIKRYPYSFSKYEKIRAQEIEELVQRHKQQEEYIKKSEIFIDRFRAKATKAAAVQTKIKELEKLEKIEIPESFKKIDIKFPQPVETGKEVLNIYNIEKAFGEKQVLQNVSFDITRGEKIALTGVNGAGKTTLLKIVAGVEEQSSGEFRLGTNVSIGYFAQDHENQIPAKLTVLEYIEQNSSTENYPILRDLLGAFLFSGDDVHKPSSVLSGGEKNRLYLLKTLLQRSNFLILDEPTNHLDIHSKDVLLKALQEFRGTILFVSHDKYFLENLAQKVIEIDNKRANIYHGDYNYYLWKKENPTDTAEQAITESARTNEDNKSKHEEYKRLKNRLRKLEREEEETLEAIESLESELERLNNELLKPEIYSCIEKSTAISTSISKIEGEITAAQDIWEKNAEEIEDIKKIIER